MLYWATGNPYPDTDGDNRGGDNLYTDCDLALDAKTGKLLWYFQFTPHDLHDWDATEPLVLVDAPFHGSKRKLLLHANRNGFLYILDRTNGALLQSSPLVKKLTWASGVGKDGRPELLPANETSPGGVKTCPAVRGATNWYSTAYNPSTNFYYVMTVEDCTLYRKSLNGGYGRIDDPSDPAMKYLRAFDIETGGVAWELPLIGPAEANYSGVLVHRGRARVFWRDERRFRRRGRKDRKISLAFRGQPAMEGLAHDLHGRRPPVRGNCIGSEYSVVFAAG